MTTSSSQKLSSTASDEDAIYRTIGWRILPILLVSYFVAYLDRVNVGFAATQMKGALGFNDAIIGLGAGIMFIGYFLFEIPSNLVLERIGIRKTLLRIMVCWGIVASATMWVQTPMQFYVARFLLGVFEAGFFPGVLLYFTYWYPAARRGKIIAIFMSTAVIANVMAGPLSGATMKFLDGVAGLAGWQWLYLTQGSPAIALGMLAYFILKDRPQEAMWLTATQREIVQRNLDADKPAATLGLQQGRWSSILRDPGIYTLSFINFLVIGSSYTMVFWTPSLIQRAGVVDVFSIGLYSALPAICGVIGMLFMCSSSDKRRERRWHFFTTTLIAVVGLTVASQFSENLLVAIPSLCVAGFGMASATPLLLSACTEYLSTLRAVIGIPLVTSVGILGAAVCPAVAGWISASTGNPMFGMYFVIALFFLAGVLFVLTFRRNPSADAEKASQTSS